MTDALADELERAPTLGEALLAEEARLADLEALLARRPDVWDALPRIIAERRAILSALREREPVALEPDWPISTDGPHKIGDHRRWLARKLMDSTLTADEAYSIVRHGLPAAPAPTLEHQEEQS